MARCSSMTVPLPTPWQRRSNGPPIAAFPPSGFNLPMGPRSTPIRNSPRVGYLLVFTHHPTADVGSCRGTTRADRARLLHDGAVQRGADAARQLAHAAVQRRRLAMPTNDAPTTQGRLTAFRQLRPLRRRRPPSRSLITSEDGAAWCRLYPAYTRALTAAGAFAALLPWRSGYLAS